MIDAMTLIMIILITVVLIITNIYVLVYFSNPVDKESCIGWFLKFIVIIGLTLAWCQVLMVPLDVSNNRTFGGGIDMKSFWFIVFIITLVYILIIFPITSSLYETEDDWTCCEKFRHSICFFLVLIIFFVGITAVLYGTIGKTDIPIKKIEYEDDCDLNEILFNSSESINFDDIKCNLKKTDESIELNVNVIIYSMSVLTFFSWIIFALFGGIGLASVPLDFFVDFKSRPQTLTHESVTQRKKILFDEIVELRDIGDELKNLEDEGAAKMFFLSGKRRKYNRLKNEFTARFSLVRKEFDILNKNNYIGENCCVIFYYLLIPLGVLSTILSLLWLVQFICSYFYIKDGRPGYPFLSLMLIYFQDHDVSFLSFLFFSILTLYLLFCVIKGNFQFGVRFLCCFAVHPMEKGKTYMNSFLFNISLVLLSSMAITQFVTDCLSDYVAFTDIDTLFNTLIKNLKFFKYFYQNHVFQYIFFAVFVLSFFYMIWQLIKKKEIIQDKSMINDIKKNKKNKINEKKNIHEEKKNVKKSDKETENSDSFDKINKKKKNDNYNMNEEKLDDDNVNNINNDKNSYEEEF